MNLTLQIEIEDVQQIIKIRLVWKVLGSKNIGASLSFDYDKED